MINFIPEVVRQTSHVEPLLHFVEKLYQTSVGKKKEKKRIQKKTELKMKGKQKKKKKKDMFYRILFL